MMIRIATRASKRRSLSRFWRTRRSSTVSTPSTLGPTILRARSKKKDKTRNREYLRAEERIMSKKRIGQLVPQRVPRKRAERLMSSKVI